MVADILLAFGARAPEGPTHPAARRLGASVAAALRVSGVLAARPFTVNVVLGERTPAFRSELVICELGDACDARAVADALDSGDPPLPAAWTGVSVGARRDLALPDHLYLQFSAQPASLSFGEYSDWYQEHQDDNIAQSEVLRRGWRYRLDPVGRGERPGPTHLAAYELDGALETLTADLGAAMAAGVISLPDWFDRFASLEAIAVGERATP